MSRQQVSTRRRLRVEALEERLCLSFGFGWADRAGSSLDPEDGTDVAADAAGNVYVTGRFQGTADFGPGVTLTAPAGGFGGFAAKYSPSGALQWARKMGSEGDGILVDGSGNIAVVGTFHGATDFGGTILTPAGSSDIFLGKLDPNGSLLWVQQYGGTDYQGIDADGGHQLVKDSAGNLYFTGDFSGDVAFGPSTLSSDFHLNLQVNGIQGNKNLAQALLQETAAYRDKNPSPALDTMIDTVTGKKAAPGATNKPATK